VKAAQKTRTDATLPILLRSFKLPAFVREYGPLADRAAAEGLSHPEYLLALAEVEDLTLLPNRNFWIRMLVGGQAWPAFTGETIQLR
jgi:hypothetical protein